MSEEELLAVCLSKVNGLGRKNIYRLLKEAGSLKGIFEMRKEEIIACIGLRYAKNLFEVWGEGGNDAVKRCLVKGEQYRLRYEKEGIRCISCMSEAFPYRLQQIPDPPFCIYVKGGLPAAQMPCVAIVGARACSTYGRSVAYSFGKELAEAGVGIISGMARGIDGIAQEGAVAGGGKTFAVLGGGVDFCYPPEHKGLYEAVCQTGGVISEYVPGTEPRANFFPERNRIISGMADLVLVIEARKRSGTYITVTQALEQGRDVFAVPGRVTDALSDGCNSLIKDGAGLADSTETILRALESCGYSLDSGSKQGNAEPERDAAEGLKGELLALIDLTPIHLEELYKRLNENKVVLREEVLVELMHMELEGLIENRGNYYSKKELLL